MLSLSKQQRMFNEKINFKNTMIILEITQTMVHPLQSQKDQVDIQQAITYIAVKANFTTLVYKILSSIT